jgi:multidrug efflux system membrane fusion protein
MLQRKGAAPRTLGGMSGEADSMHFGRMLARASIHTVALCSLALPALAQQPAPQPPSAVPVTTAIAQRLDVPVYRLGLGAVQAFQQVLVRARVDGTLEQIAFTEGQDVKKGELLAVIDPRPYQAALDLAKAKKAQDVAQLQNAKLDLQRYTSLLKSDFAARQQADTQAAQVQQYVAMVEGDDASIATAQLNLDFCRITSPIDGRVGLRQVDVGNLIHANDASGIVTITQIHPISVTFTLPQDDLPSIKTAMRSRKLAVFAYSADDKTVLDQGELLTPDNAIDPATGTIKLKSTFPNAKEQLWPGQFVNVRLLLDTLKDVVTVPSDAVQRGPNGRYVYLVKPDQTVTLQLCEVAHDDGKVAAIETGVANGAIVVVAGQLRLAEGAKVAATPVKTGG